jgi:hypothetical protein
MDADFIVAASSGSGSTGGLWVVVALITAVTGLVAALTSAFTALRKLWARDEDEADHQELEDLIALLLEERERRRRRERDGEDD